MSKDSLGQSPISARTLSSWKTVPIVVASVSLIGGGLWYWRSCNAGAGGWSGGGPIDVVAIGLKPTVAPRSLEALGELRAVRQVSLSSEVAGRVIAISFKPGQQVKAGDVLVQLDDSAERAELAAAKATAEFAQHQLARASELVSVGAVSSETLQQRQAERDQSAAQVRRLEVRILQKQIRASFAGELGLRRIDLGQYLNPGEVVATLTNLDHLYVDFDVPQQELGRIRIGSPLHVRVDKPGARSVRATVSAIEPLVGRDTRNASIQAEMSNDDQRLQPGMYATVSVELPAEADALMVPASAVTTSPSGDTAVVVRNVSSEKVGKADIVPIVVDRRIGDQVVIKKGLRAGDFVVTEGQLRVRPGGDLRLVDRIEPVAGGKA